MICPISNTLQWLPCAERGVPLPAAAASRSTRRMPASPGVRTWCGDFLQLPAFMGSAHAITMNAVFGNLPDPREALLKAALLLQPGGHVLVSHPMGRAWHTQLHRDAPDIVPHELPDKDRLQELIAGLPLQLVEFMNEKDVYAAVLQVSTTAAGAVVANATCCAVCHRVLRHRLARASVPVAPHSGHVWRCHVKQLAHTNTRSCKPPHMGTN